MLRDDSQYLRKSHGVPPQHIELVHQHHEENQTGETYQIEDISDKLLYKKFQRYYPPWI